jgi:ABC-type branched-subunit amino acid transport system permease subunit/energy-coupling factor transporter ATP-binding protein EcfA2
MMSGRVGLRTIGLLAVSLVVLPFVLALAGMTITIATKVTVFALLALGFNVLLGYTGLVSFGHAVFFGGGAYVAALTQLHLTPGSIVLPILAALLFGTAMGVILGFLVLRRGGVYFSLLTLAFAAMTFYIVFRWTAVTGGENGLGGLRRPTLLGMDLNDGHAFYILVALIVLLVATLLWRFLDSPVGRVLLAIRENRERTQFLGYEVRHYKMAAFTVSATVSGLAGGLFVFTTYFASADLVSVPFSGEILVMTIIGGMHSFLGPAVGALFYVFFRDLLSAYTNSWQLWFGLLFVGFILFSPGGIAGIGDRVLTLAGLRRGREAAMSGRRVSATQAPLPAFIQPVEQSGTLLEARGISKHFGPFRAVDSVDMALPARGLKVLIGPNGAGKTTLLQSAVRALRTQRGPGHAVRRGCHRPHPRCPAQARHLPLVPDHQSVPAPDRVGKPAPGRTGPAPRPPQPMAFGRVHRGDQRRDAQPGRLRRPGRPGRRHRGRSVLRRPAPAGNRRGPGRRPASAAARRTAGRSGGAGARAGHRADRAHRPRHQRADGRARYRPGLRLRRSHHGDARWPGAGRRHPAGSTRP